MDQDLAGESRYAPTYALAMRDAHRKPYQSLRAPALTQHLVFRKGPFDHANDARWITRIETIILTVFETLQDRGPQPRIGNFRQRPISERVVDQPDGVDARAIGLLRNRYVRRSRDGSPRFLYEQLPIKGDGRYETVIIETIWRGLVSTLRFEVFEEHFSLTVTLELRALKEHAESFGAERADLEASRYAVALQKVKKWIDDHKDGAAGSELSGLPVEIANALKLLSLDVWKELGDEVLRLGFTASTRVLVREAGRNPPPSDAKADKRKPPPDDIVGHFTGIVLGVDTLNGHPGTIRGAGFDTDAERTTLRHRRYWPEQAAFKDGGAERWASVLFPLVHSASEAAQGLHPNGSDRSPFEAAEYTWTLFDGGTALYGSAFGPQGEAGSPLQYILLFDHDEHRAIGRTVHRLHTMGAMRLAAMFDLDKAIDRDRILSRLDAELAVYEATVGIEVLQARQFIDWESLARELGFLDKVLRESVLLFSEQVTQVRARDAEVVDASAASQRSARLRSAADELTHKLAAAIDEAHDSSNAGRGSGDIVAMYERLLAVLERARNSSVATQGTLRERQATAPTPQNHRRAEDHERTDSEELSTNDWPQVTDVLNGLENVIGYLHRLAEELSSPSWLRQPLTTEDERKWTVIKAQTSAVIRAFDRLRLGRTAKSYRQTILADVERAVGSMSNRLRMGVEIRAARTNYYLERLKDLVHASNPLPVVGYQPYGMFVDHRLDRAYSLLRQVNTKYQTIAERTRLLRLASERKDSSASVRRIELMQKLAEVAFFVVLGPYYSAGLLTSILGLGQDDKQGKAWMYAGAWVFWLLLFLWHGKHERRKARQEQAMGAAVHD